MIIMGSNWKTGPPPTKMVCLAGLEVPRVGRRDTPDEPFAFGAREFLRKKVIGKTVQFRIDYVVPGGTRELGVVKLGEEDLAAAVVGAGWACVHHTSAAPCSSLRRPDLTRSLPRCATASCARRARRTLSSRPWRKLLRAPSWACGKRCALSFAAHIVATPRVGPRLSSVVVLSQPTPPGAVREVSDGVEDAMAIKNRAGGRELDAVVEYIMDAGRMRVLMGPPYHLITFNLSGVSVPSIRRQEDGSEVAAPFAREAKFLVERKLLNRDVKITLEGVDKYNNFFGTLKYKDGSSSSNLAIELLGEGMAKCANVPLKPFVQNLSVHLGADSVSAMWSLCRCVEWSMKFAAEPLLLRAAEREAKQARRRVFKDWVPPGEGPNAIQDAEFEATVAEARSGDTVVITKAGGEAETITLSSIRAPKLGNARRDTPYEPYSWEAREFVRNYVGKKCLVKLEYKRVLPVTENTPEGMGEKVLLHATIKVSNSKKGTPDLNLAEKLCEAGLVSVIQHREEDERSEYYDDLLTAEDTAKKNSKWLHGAASPTPRRFNDLTAQDPARASARLPSLQRQGKMRAVVEYCYSGSRFKLFIPKEDTFANFTLSTVSCPQTAGRREGAVDEPFGQEATDFARALLLQRDVFIHIESANRGGTFMGSLMYNKTEQYDLTLLREGLGYVSGYKATDQQYSLEAQAKTSKLKIWEVYKDEDAADEAATVSDSEFEEVVVAEIVEAGHFYTQAKGEKGLEWVAGQMAALDLESKSPPAELPAKGELVCANWQGDWYRAKILGKTKDDEGTPLARIHFIDYGNSDLAVLEQLRPIDAALSSMEPLAKECKLACLKCPDAEHDFGADAAGFFRELVWGKELVAKVEYREGKTQFVTLFDGSGSAGLSANSAMLREGLARVNTRQKDSRLSDLVTKLLADEQVGKKERLNMWQWGDAGDEEDEALDVGGMRRRT